ncbi:MAG: sodium transport system permease protein [Mariniblastus sp.]|jgi:sodium transport system permease protein
MKWDKVKLIFKRELRDQLRDRRTLFTVAIMPMVLYPLMGMAMLQVAQFMREDPSQVWIVGAENLPTQPALIVEGVINPELGQNESRLINLVSSVEGDQEFQAIIKQLREQPDLSRAPGLVDQLIQQEMQARGVDVAIFIPSQIKLPNRNLAADDDEPSAGNENELPPEGELSPASLLPEVYIFQNSAIDKSRIGSERLNGVLRNWTQAVVKQTLDDHDVSLSLVRGVRIANADVADKNVKQAAAWSKILPFIVMIWSLTGAFYPAIDLCAGEKERGTFETLLSSPAQRSEIAIGKLLTVMTFSMATSLLNLLSMGFTGMFVMTRLGSGMGIAGGLPIGAPPLASIGWLILALIPISALFSAVALAAAAFARSSKEGQYYLVPLMMISMPLMMIPMLPTAQLDFGTSLIPVSGLMLLLKGLIEGQYAECMKFAAPVCAVTLICCWVSIRWVVHQFNSETVMFRASEQFGVGAWFRHVMRERHDLPSFGNAILCVVVILVAKFFIGFAVSSPINFNQFALQTVIILVATVAVPAIMMALVLTRNPGKSLRIRGCSLPMASAAILAAIALNPMLTWFTALVIQIYPPGGDIAMLESAVSRILESSPGLWATLLIFAVAPAIFEEFAFRGFILSGFESLGGKWKPILLTSLMFGLAHGVIQQTMITFVVGMMLGVIAIQTKSILPCILFHLTHNSMAVLLSKADTSVVEHSPILSTLLYSSDGASYQYSMFPAILMSVVGVALIVWFLLLDAKPSSHSEGRSRLANAFSRLVSVKHP